MPPELQSCSARVSDPAGPPRARTSSSAADALEMLDLPQRALTLSETDLTLNQPGILPPGVERRRLDAGSYALHLPGMNEEVRVTTQAEVFDDHFQSHPFLSPGGNLFEQIASQCLTDNESGPTAGDGKIWLVIDQTTQNLRILARRSSLMLAVTITYGVLGIHLGPRPPSGCTHSAPSLAAAFTSVLTGRAGFARPLTRGQHFCKQRTATHCLRKILRIY